MANQNTVTLMIFGDISLNGDLATREPGSWQLFPKDLRDMLPQVDYLLFNFESPLEGSGRENELKWPRLKTTSRALDKLSNLDKAIAVFANNHIYDCLEEGFRNTKRSLSALGIASLGAGLNVTDAEKPLMLERKGIKIGFLSYVDPSTHPSIPVHVGFQVNILERDRMITDIIQLREHLDHIVVYLHWGIDHFYYPSPSQVSLPRELIDFGATIIAGSHAHVVQSWEEYNGGLIFYGLGNACFGTGDGLAYRKENRLSLIPFFELGPRGDCFLRDLRAMQRSPDGLSTRLLSTEEFIKLSQLYEPIPRQLDAYIKRFKYKSLIHRWIIRPWRFFFNDQYSFITQIKRIRINHFQYFWKLLGGRG